MTSAVSEPRPVAVATATPPERAMAATRLRHAAVASNLYLWETLVALRLPWRLTTFRIAIWCLGGVVFLLVTTVGSLTGAAVAGMKDPRLAAAVVAGSAMVLTYAAIAHTARDALSGLNPANPQDPRHGVVRALDLDMAVVALVHCGTPRLPLSLLGSSMLVSMALPLQTLLSLGAWSVAALGAYPLLLGLAGTGAASIVTSTQSRGGLPKVLPVVALAGLAGVAGLGLGPVLDRALADRPTLDPTPLLEAVPVALLVLGVVAMASISGLFMVRPGRVRMGSAGGVTSARRAGGRAPLERALMAQVVASSTFPAIRNSVTGAGLLLAAGLGARFGGLEAELESPRAQAALVGAMAMVVLSVTEALSRSVGPILLAPTMRLLWELGADRRRLAVSMLLGCLIPLSVSGLLTTALYWVITGSPSLAPLLLHLVGAGAWVVAECLVPPLRNPDGSAMYNAVTGVTILALTAPVMLAVWSQSSWATPALAGYTLVLLGGAFSCLTTRVLSMPSYSAT